MKTIRNVFVTALALAAASFGLFEWWSLDLRWRPHEISKDQAEITKILEGSGWVSPGLTGPKLYVVAYRASPQSQRLITDVLPALQKAAVDTRVIMIARADLNGAALSTANERSTVAELWVNRRWALFQNWMAAPADNWAATGLPPADGDVARSAVVAASQEVVDKLTPLLQENGIRFAYPVLIWWNKDGKMEGCACTDPRQDRYVLKDLGAE
ncbi:MAG: hypothetical protein JO303_13660 [Caulobacteraceae bacterium]|nr:hypothetical protein [Caulobacteraceae bacterium]